MLGESVAFSSFSVDDAAKAKQFYSDKLGLTCTDRQMGGMLEIKLANGGNIMVYPKGKDHVPATFTVLNFLVNDIDKAVDELTAKGIEMQHYDMKVDNYAIKTDEKGIARDEEFGPPIAWFNDPAGNTFALMQDTTK